MKIIMKGKKKYLNYMGLKTYRRPYKKMPLMLSLIIAGIGIIPMIPFVFTIPIAMKFLLKFG